MNYPTLEQYNEALQHPKTAFFDSELKSGIVLSNGLGLPLALCGGFALTYGVQCNGKKYAVRCFHKKSDTIESRYKAISNKIKAIRSSYFVNFEFQTAGVNVNGQKAPIVKMAWASGETLGEFLECNYRNKEKIQLLNASLGSLADYLEGKGLAHGDIQPGNVMVSSGGRSIQLIDYDGIYVDDIERLGSDNDGHRNFQHSKRDKHAWNAHLDRFSFIELNLSLRILESYPQFWDETKSDGDSILFKANDFADPGSSLLFNKLFGVEPFSDDARNFAAICRSPFDKIPTLKDFIARRNIPQAVISISRQGPMTSRQYIGAFPVLNAGNYELCLKHVGDRVELIGQIQEVKYGETRHHKKPYVFINFGSWRGKVVKISIWSEGLSLLSQMPGPNWIGKWITVTGLMEPPYHNKKFNYSHLSISITQANQLVFLNESDARYRLGLPDDAVKSSSATGRSTNTTKPEAASSNRNVLAGMKGNTIPRQKSQIRAGQPISKNQSVLQTMKQQQSQDRQIPHQSTPPKTYQGQTVGNGSNCFIASTIYGPSAPETNILRKWRDDNLLPYLPGRLLIDFYYFVSPSICKLIVNHGELNRMTRNVLNHFISLITH
jgi:serine/threonine protein kinase